MLKFAKNLVNQLKINEIKIDDSQTGYYWLQIFVKNQKEAFSVRERIFQDQDIRERLHTAIKQSQEIVTKSSIELEVILNNMIIEKLQLILDGEKEI